MHVKGMQHVERISGERTTMHDYVRRELGERRREESRVPRHGVGRGRARHTGVDGKGVAQWNHPEPQHEPLMEMEQQVEGDVEAQDVGDDEQQQQRVPSPEELDDYSGDLHDLTVLTKYHVHVIRMAVDGVVRNYTFYCDILMIVNCC